MISDVKKRSFTKDIGYRIFNSARKIQAFIQKVCALVIKLNTVGELNQQSCNNCIDRKLISYQCPFDSGGPKYLLISLAGKIGRSIIITKTNCLCYTCEEKRFAIISATTFLRK